MSRAAGQALEVEPGQYWLALGRRSLIQVTEVDDDLVFWQKTAGTGPRYGRIRTSSLVRNYEQVDAEGETWA